MIRGDEGTEVRGYENTYNVALLRVKSILVPPYPRTPVPPYPRTSVPPNNNNKHKTNERGQILLCA